MWESIQKFNRDSIPFYISVPEKDLELFKANIHDPDKLIHWVTDENVVVANSAESLKTYREWDGRLSQQVIKSEFWRLFTYPISYLCIDSESKFIKNFYLSDFLHEDGHPYTVMHQNKELLQLATNKGVLKVPTNFYRESETMKKVFGRVGVDYDFGPTPVIWSSKVWRDLDEKYFKPKRMTIWDAILSVPSELRWYGEALCFYGSIPIHSIESMFRVYHYDWQYFFSKKNGETEGLLIQQYLGVLKQSNWDYELDYGQHATRKSLLSRVVRRLKRVLSHFKS